MKLFWDWWHEPLETICKTYLKNFCHSSKNTDKNKKKKKKQFQNFFCYMQTQKERVCVNVEMQFLICWITLRWPRNQRVIWF